MVRYVSRLVKSDAWLGDRPATGRGAVQHAEMYSSVERYFQRHLRDGAPEPTAAHAVYVVLDTFGTMLRGFSHDAAVRRFAEASPLEPELTTIFQPPFRRTATNRAVIVNAAAIASTELSEGNRHAKGHMAIQVLPGLLAAAERLGSSGQAFLDAFVIGYDVSARMALASKRHFRAYGHGVYAPAATAVAVGALEGADGTTLVELLRIAGNLSQAPAFITHFEGATVRNLTAGIGGSIGVMVPEFARAGFLGSDAAMEVTLGETLGSAFSRESFVSDMGERFLIDENYFKLFASGRHMHAATEAFAQVLGDHALSDADIADIAVTTYYPASTMSDIDPPNALAAKTSIPYCLAAYAVVGHNGADAFEEPVLTDPRVRRLAARVRVVEDVERTERGGWGAETTTPQRSAQVEVTAHNGRQFHAECRQTRGDYDTPVTRDELEAKFMELTSHAVGEVVAERLMATIMSMRNQEPFVEQVRDVLLGRA